MSSVRCGSQRIRESPGHACGCRFAGWASAAGRIVGLANAKGDLCHVVGPSFGGSFAGLRAAGAHAPKCLWASTGVKNPQWRDTRYVEALIGPDTVDAVPDKTLEAFADHGEAIRTLDIDLGLQALRVTEQAVTQGLDLDAVGDELQKAGLLQFEQAFDHASCKVWSDTRPLRAIGLYGLWIRTTPLIKRAAPKIRAALIGCWGNPSSPKWS